MHTRGRRRNVVPIVVQHFAAACLLRAAKPFSDCDHRHITVLTNGQKFAGTDLTWLCFDVMNRANDRITFTHLRPFWWRQ